MRIRHLHLPSPKHHHLTHYAHASTTQDHLVRSLLASKPSYHPHSRPPSSFPRNEHKHPRPPSPPTILTAEFHPVYTCGRRDIAKLSADQIAHLRASGAAEFYEALRGGQTTYHGPGQLVAYPILDLKRHGCLAAPVANPFAPSAAGARSAIGPREYVHLLEESVVRTLAQYGVHGFRTENPGVWTSADEKICALGVHMRRNVTSHGVGCNVKDGVLPWFDRIVACGLENKRATTLQTRMRAVGGSELSELPSIRDVAAVFVKEFVRVFGLGEEHEIASIGEDQLPVGPEVLSEV